MIVMQLISAGFRRLTMNMFMVAVKFEHRIDQMQEHDRTDREE